MHVVFASYDTWMTDTDIDADVDPPLEPDGPYQVRASKFLLMAHMHTCTHTILMTISDRGRPEKMG